MYTSGLIPRPLALLGLIAGPVLLVGNLGVLFGLWEVAGVVGLFVAPEFAWELLLGLYAAIWGFRRAAPSSRRAAHDIPVRATRLALAIVQQLRAL